MSLRDDLLVFAGRAMTANKELDNIEETYRISLGRAENRHSEQDPAYYLQFPEDLRIAAAEMSKHYETIYCLETSLRQIVSQQMRAFFEEDDWWAKRVPEHVRVNVENNRKREADAGVSSRSSDPLDYTTFGELSFIIIQNWDAFSDLFNNKKAVERVLGGLNMLRAPVAHCAILASDEIARLELSIKDFYRLME
jgi:hypothetical protein